MDVASRIKTKTSITGTNRRLRLSFPCRNKSGEMMFAIRVYVCALTALFLVLVTLDRGVGLLEGIVITCAIVYMILDVRADLQMLKREVQQLEQLERHLAVLLSN